MAMMLSARQNRFFKWLNNHVAPVQLSEYYQVFLEIEDIIRTNRYLHHLTKTLSNTTDVDEVKQFYNDLSSNNNFIHSTHPRKKLNLIRYYIQYLEENPSENMRGQAVSQMNNDEIEVEDALINKLKRENVLYTDNRSKGGVLWFADSGVSCSIVNEFKGKGYFFSYSFNKEQWWTKDCGTVQKKKTDAVTQKKTTDEVEPRGIKQEKEAFVKWMESQKFSTVDVFSIYGTVRKINKMLIDQKMNANGLYSITDIGYLRQIIDRVKNSTAFIIADRKENYLWTRTLYAYLRFMESTMNSSHHESRPTIRNVLREAKPEEKIEKPEKTEKSEQKQIDRTEMSKPLPKKEESKAVEPVLVEAVPKQETASLSNCEDSFRKWMEQYKKDQPIDQVIGAVRAAENFARRNHMNTTRLYGVPHRVAKQSINKLIASHAFSRSDPRIYRTFRHLIPIYVEFLTELEGVPSAQKEQVVSNEISTNQVEKQKEVPYLETELLDILEDSQYTELREVLVKQGLTTLDQFKKLNLWVFMNQNGLYSIGKRYEIYNYLQRVLQNEPEKVTQAKYRLKTGKETYEGKTPADVLLHYCEHMLIIHPLSMRALIGQRYNGNGSVVLNRESVNPNDLQITNPEAYINEKLTAEALMVYAKWICKMCKDSDIPKEVERPISKEEPEKENGSSGGEVRNDVDPQTQTVVYPGQPIIPKTTVKPVVKLQPVYAPPSVFKFTEPDQPEKKDVVSALAGFERPAQPIHPAVPAEKEKPAIKPQPIYAPPSASEFTEPVHPEKKADAFTRKVENMVLGEDLDGMTLDKLYTKLTNATMVGLERICDKSENLVVLQDKIVHVDAFVDFEEAADHMEEILEKLLNKNNGYVSAKQLYEYVRMEMQMFLIDNDMDDERSVYMIAKHLFEKVGWKDRHYVFTGNMHISRAGEKALHNKLDIVTKYARDSGGIFVYTELEEYLESVGVKTGNLRTTMQIGTKPLFFDYTADELILVECMGIDEVWINQTKNALSRLFEDAGDHVVLRSVRDIWYNQLPALPGQRPWTVMLLQYVLQFYGKQLGARTIEAMSTQCYGVIHCMIVSEDSEVQTFSDAVIAYLVDRGIQKRTFEEEELRSVLVEGEMIAGNELIGNMSKALAGDPRFAWDIQGKNVNIKV